MINNIFHDKEGLKIINNNDVKKIHKNSLYILENLGIKVEGDSIFDLLFDFGCDIDKVNKIVRIKEDIVMKALELCPKAFYIYDQNGKKYEIGKGKTYFTSAGKINKILDFNTNKIRNTTIEDTRNFIKILDYLDEIDFVRSIASVSTTGNTKLDILYTIKEMFLNTNKHIIENPLSYLEAKILIDLTKIIMENKYWPIITIQISPTAPLIIIKEILKIIMLCIENDVPILILSLGLSGGTFPMTLAGSITLTNVEILFTIVLIQALKKGHPIIYGSSTSPLYMRNCVVSRGTPEYGLIINSVVEMAKFYKLPSYTGPGTTDSVKIDVQSGIQKMFLHMAAISNGLTICSGEGQLATAMLCSFEQLLIDNEIIKYIKRFFKGVNINNDTLAIDSIIKAKQGGNFLYDDKTLKYMKDPEEYYISEIFNIGGLSGKCEDVIKNANKSVEFILKNYKPFISNDKKEKVLDFVKQYEVMIRSNNG